MVNSPFLNQTKTTQLQGRKPGESFHCYQITILIGEHTGIWQEVNPVSHALPTFITQLIIITSLTRLLLLLTKPLRQPRIVAEILAGALLGPSVMGRLKQHSQFLDAVFSIPSFMALETMGNIGLIYFLFLIGLEMDMTTINRVGKKPLAIASAGTIFPFLIGVASYYLLLPNLRDDFQLGSIVWGTSLTITSLPVTAQILAELKLLSTDVGKTTMSAALVNTITSWVLVTIMMAIGSDSHKAPWALLSTLGFVLLCVFVIRPITIWTIRRTQKGGSYSEETICIILTAVLGCGLATDLLGTSSMVGAFLFGIVIPNGLLGPRFLEVLKGFVEDLLMPIFFTVSGMRTNLEAVAGGCSWYHVAGVVVLACLGKVVSTVVVSLVYGMRITDGVALGVLMNTKGILALIALNVGRDRGMLEDKAFTVMFISIMVMTMATQPLLSILYKPKTQFLPNKHRAIQRLKPDAELRILACIHEPHSVPAIIRLLEASNPSRRYPIAVFALRLIQLTGHTTALLIIHAPTKSASDQESTNSNNQIHEAFERFEKEHGGVSVQPLTAVSPYGTMHEDICSIAEDKRVTLIILPYHKRQTIHNKMEEVNHAYKDVNNNVLANSPCSVGILVDRGFTGGDDGGAQHIAMLFIGGADDREALCYARRMAAGNPNVTLTVVRFVQRTSGVVELKLSDLINDEEDDEEIHKKKMTESRADESFISEFRVRTMGDKSIVYLEKAVSNGAETIEILRAMGQGGGYDLFVVGRGTGKSSSSSLVTAGIDEWSECRELGTIGDLLVTAEFSSTVSVLVVRQYGGGRGGGGDGVITMNKPPSSLQL
ncbi:cation/H(+) antiporter 15-like [Rhododendron vialii]|uniref:cation/H(+) antiporter 15-like n=1 Tax=Rhododendron vialii TaxID=182163 RepID=UPI00265EEED3|nr:cation/H(+) antiporter 15-like [Rhododendron vialii]